MTDDMYPDSFPSAAKSLISRILVADPKKRLTDYNAIKSHPLFHGIEWDVLHRKPAPQIQKGTISTHQVDSKWARRKNSIMWYVSYRITLHCLA